MGWSDSEVGFDCEAGKKTDKEEGKTYLLKIVCLFYEQYSTLGYILDIEISKFLCRSSHMKIHNFFGIRDLVLESRIFMLLV